MKPMERIPEGGAIRDSSLLSCEEYGKRMRDALGEEYRRFARRANAVLHLPRGSRVLEIGPGPGWAGIELLKLRPDITLTAIDASPDMIRAARKNVADEGILAAVSYEEGVAEDLSRFAAGSFDAVISRDSLHHWIDPAKAFGEMERILTRTGGVYVADERRDLGFAEWLIVRLARKRIGTEISEGWINSIRASWTPAEIRESFPIGGGDRRIARWRARPVFLGLEITRAPRRGAS